MHLIHLIADRNIIPGRWVDRGNHHTWLRDGSPTNYLRSRWYHSRKCAVAQPTNADEFIGVACTIGANAVGLSEQVQSKRNDSVEVNQNHQWDIESETHVLLLRLSIFQESPGIWRTTTAGLCDAIQNDEGAVSIEIRGSYTMDVGGEGTSHSGGEETSDQFFTSEESWSNQSDSRGEGRRCR